MSRFREVHKLIVYKTICDNQGLLLDDLFKLVRDQIPRINGKKIKYTRPMLAEELFNQLETQTIEFFGNTVREAPPILDLRSTAISIIDEMFINDWVDSVGPSSQNDPVRDAILLESQLEEDHHTSTSHRKCKHIPKVRQSSSDPQKASYAIPGPSSARRNLSMPDNLFGSIFENATRISGNNIPLVSGMTNNHAEDQASSYESQPAGSLLSNSNEVTPGDVIDCLINAARNIPCLKKKVPPKIKSKDGPSKSSRSRSASAEGKKLRYEGHRLEFHEGVNNSVFLFGNSFNVSKTRDLNEE